MNKIRQKYCSWWMSFLKPCQKTGKCFGESLRGVKELQIFGMSNKTIIEFDFRMMSRLNYADLGGCYPHPTRSALSFTSYSASFNDC